MKARKNLLEAAQEPEAPKIQAPAEPPVPSCAGVMMPKTLGLKWARRRILRP